MMSERAIERILQEEQDERKVQKAIDRYLKIKEDLDKYLEEHYISNEEESK